MGRSTIKRDSQKQQVVLTRFASKGVVSLILPSELRPYIQSTGERIDFIYSPFGVFSRMNLSQVLELTCGKATHRIDQLIKNDPNNISNYLLELRKTWTEESNLMVRIAQIESRILSVDGVVDIFNTKINGSSENLTLDKYEVPIFGGITNESIG